MLSKKEIKDIQSLSHKKFRDELNLFVAEGPKNVAELIALVPQQIEKVYAVKSWLETNQLLMQYINFLEVSDSELERLSQLQAPNQVVALIKKLPAKKPDTPPFTLYLDTIQDPGNFGTIVRIADWFGIKNIVCTPGCADLYNLKVVQSTMASIARVNVYYDEGRGWLREQNLPVYAATLQGTSLATHPKVDKGILIVGNESKGISKEILQHATEQITIPKIGEAESLNAAVATGIILSHLLK
ncbi:MAG TPA: RNA methyltransferase [Flavisolibacter sp.]|jgi:TrmH family RNA methyltransferase|nr:RNA methyltransferase [Flavisolibacter sp.]